MAVEVGTGTKAETFHCFAALLHRSSTYFRKELSSVDFKFSANSLQLDNLLLLTLPNEKPSDFARYHEFMDKERLWTTIADLDAFIPFELASLFCFAERIGAQCVKTAVIKSLHAKTRLLTTRIGTKNEAGKKQDANVYFSPYCRAARWLANNTSVQPDSGLYIYHVHFFAYFVLQTVPRLEQKVLNDLPASFLWHVLCAVNEALKRHVPGGPRALHTDTEVATNDATDMETTSVTAIDTDDDDATTAEPDQTQAPKHTYAHAMNAINSLPKTELIQTILLQSAVLRIYKNVLLDKGRARKESGAKKKRRQKANMSDDEDIKAMDDSAPIKKFIGIEDLCMYHGHAAGLVCARRSAMDDDVDGQGVWGLVPVLKG